MKEIRHAVRVLAFRGDQILCLHYEHGPMAGFLDFPGGKIEEGESEIDACIRELKEESGLDVSAEDLRYIGRIINNAPERLFDLQTYIAAKVTGELHNSEGDTALWLPISTVVQTEKRLPVAHILDADLVELLQTPGFEVSFESDANRNIISHRITKAPEH